MAKRNQVSIDITANDKATTPLQKVTARLNETTAAVRSATDPLKKLQNSFTNFSLAVPGVKLLGDAFGKLKGSVTECVDAFAEIEKSTKQLNFAQNINLQLKAAGADLTRFASDVSKTIGNVFSAGEIQSAISELAFDHTIEQIESITSVALDLSAATGKDLKSSVDILADTMNGRLNTELKRIAPELANLDSEALKSGEAIGVLGSKLKGLAEDMSGTTGASITAFNNTMGDLKETLGDMFSTAMTPMRNWFTELLGNLNKTIVEYNNLKRAKAQADSEHITSADALLLRNDAIKSATGKYWGNGVFTPELAQDIWNDAHGFAPFDRSKYSNISADVLNEAVKNVTAVLKGTADDMYAWEDTASDIREYNKKYLDAKRAELEAQKEAARQAQEIVIAQNAQIEAVETAEENTSAIFGRDAIMGMNLRNSVNNGGFNLGLAPLTGAYDPAMDMEPVELSTTNGYSAFGGTFLELAATMAEVLGPLVSGMQSFATMNEILNPLTTIMRSMFETLDPVLNSIIMPLSNILKIVGQTLGQILIPLIEALTPVIEVVMKAFTWLYNNVLRPVGNSIISLFNMFYNAVVGVCNGFIAMYNLLVSKKNEKDYMSYKSLDSGHLAEITDSYVRDYGSVNTGTTSGGSASYQAARDITVNVTYSHSFVNGDAREIALNIRDELRNAEALGY